MQVSYFETGRSAAAMPMSAGAYDREAGFCAFLGMVERSWEGAAAPVRAARWPNGYPVAD